MFYASKIAEYHCNLNRLHDEENWKTFRENATRYIISLGYNSNKAKKASFHVMRAYQYADIAVIAQNKGKEVLEKKYYRKVLEEFLTAHRLLGTETKSPTYKVGWYKGARHKKPIQVLWNLFMEHLSKFGLKRIGLVFYATYLTFARAYPAHNSHDWENLTSVLTEYWTAISKSYKTKSLPVEL